MGVEDETPPPLGELQIKVGVRGSRVSVALVGTGMRSVKAG